MKPISVGLAGFGTGGSLFHAPFLDADPSFSLDFVYERTRDQARSLYPSVQRLERMEDLLSSSCELVVIALPNRLHASWVRAALEAGKHVLCDKPLCESSGEALELASFAEEKGRMLSVYQNRRYDSEIRTLKHLMATHRLGDLKDVTLSMERYRSKKNPKEWKNVPGEATGIHYDLGIHLLDSAYALFGMPLEISASLRTLHSCNTVPDRMEAQLFYPNGLCVGLCASQCAMLPGPCLIAHGTQGSFVQDACDAQEALLNQGLTPRSPAWKIPPAYGTLRTQEGEERLLCIPGDYGEYYRGLAHGLAEGQAPVSGREAAQVLRMLEALVESHEGKRVVRL